MSKVQLNIVLTKEEKEKIRTEAKKQYLTMSMFIRQVLSEYIQSQNGGDRNGRKA